ncbi:coiled-coil domain-containing protein 38 isoform X3 [Perognathus longimembris pacificus]|nr:coiled-coil domain-containing protein 38 isoform X3 [Perognathus longimembris pacificus]XP_048213844.1 coiled-coil domain-containing protein 38 isoform X3 [Perognathus longimembris pacificus]XP_048213853.1 coiled-coil domain-containing protein 38 isoform X3 [Perognathus longimembris pacificus]XP_048213857.1 coiled-coil domain-containing protein 38 isoform X3 [Perognathus longimembris pacificus]
MSSHLVSSTLNLGGNARKDAGNKDKPYKVFVKDLFLFKENELAAKKKEKILNQSMKVHEKTTFSSRMKSRSHLSKLAYYTEKGGSLEDMELDPTLILRLTEGADAKRTLFDFISDQRGRFLLEYALATKKNTIKKLDKCMTTKENQLKKAEKKLQDDAMAFEEFLRENDQRSVDALKIAAQETLHKLQMTAELKKANMEMQMVKSDIAKTEFLLREYMQYGHFLFKLSPKHWQIQQTLKKSQAAKSTTALPKIVPKITVSSHKKHHRVDGSEKTSEKTSSDEYSTGKVSKGKQRKKSIYIPEPKKSSSRPDSSSSEDSIDLFLDGYINFTLEPEIYFKEPEELLQVLTELEEQNLNLVQYSQEIDENLEDVNRREKILQDKISSNVTFLLEHKEMLKAQCMREEEKAAELELRSRLFNFGEFNSDTQVCGDSHLEQNQEVGQNTPWRMICFAQQFLETLLASEASCTKDKDENKNKDENGFVPKYVTATLKILHGQLKQRSVEEKLIQSLSKKINQVYTICIGDAEVGSMTAVQKLVKVENRLVELSDLIESIPKENVEAIERIKQKERRQKIRDEKMREKQLHQEERLKAALQRAVAQPKKKVCFVLSLATTVSRVCLCGTKSKYLLTYLNKEYCMYVWTRKKMKPPTGH